MTIVYLGLGSNLDNPVFGAPRQVLEAALAALPTPGLSVRSVSPFYETAPVPLSDQPWYVNAVCAVETHMSPSHLLAHLQGIEAQMGRKRAIRNEARVLDLDILDFGGLVLAGGEVGPAAGIVPVLPHPRMAERAFVLYPLRDLAPDWRHPATGATLGALIAALPPGQMIRRLG